MKNTMTKINALVGIVFAVLTAQSLAVEIYLDPNDPDTLRPLVVGDTIDLTNTITYVDTEDGRSVGRVHDTATFTIEQMQTVHLRINAPTPQEVNSHALGPAHNPGTYDVPPPSRLVAVAVRGRHI